VVSAGATFGTSTNSATAFQVQNSAGSSLLDANTVASNQNNLLTNPGFELSLSGNWALKGNASDAVSQVTSPVYEGNDALKIITTANAGDGTKQVIPSTLATSSHYSASFYVKLDASSKAFATLAAGYSSTGASDDTACALNTATVVSNGWTQVECTFTTPGTTNSSNYFYIKQTDGVIHTFYVDAVLLQTDANSDTNYRDGSLTLQAAVVSPVVFQNTTNSNTALAVQALNGSSVFNVSTLNGVNLVSNSNFEANVNNWSAIGTGTTISRDPTYAYAGASAMKVVTGTATNSGAELALNPVVTLASTTYTVSWYARLAVGDATAFTDITAVYSPDGTATSNCSVTAMNAQTVANSGWTRFYCSVSSSTTPTTGGYLLLRDTAGTAHTFYVDAVQLEQNTIPTAYGDGAVALDGILNSPVNIKNVNDSTTAFTVQNASGTNTLLTIDTLDGTTTFGNSTNGVTYGSTYEPTLSGTAQHVRKIVLTPEYAGAVLDTGGQTSVTGTMTAGVDTTPNPKKTYYNWTTSQGSAQTYDIVCNVPIPADWASWSGSPTFDVYQSSTAAGNTITAFVQDNAGSYDTNFTSSGQAISATSTSTWQTKSPVAFSGSYAANGFLTIRLRMSVTNAANTRMGNIVLTYNSKW
jgi:hypothetical protein